MVTVSCAVRRPAAVRDNAGLREPGVAVQPAASPDCHPREFADPRDGSVAFEATAHVVIEPLVYTGILNEFGLFPQERDAA